jgi:hypothetical protein
VTPPGTAKKRDFVTMLTSRSIQARAKTCPVKRTQYGATKILSLKIWYANHRNDFNTPGIR